MSDDASMDACEACGNSRGVHGASGDYLGCLLAGGERLEDPVFGSMTTPPEPCSRVRDTVACHPKPLSGLRATLHANWNRTMGDGEVR